MSGAAALAAAVEALTGTPVARLQRVAGGDINDAYRAELVGDGSLFVKTHPDPPPGFFAAEAEGLQQLAATGTVRVPAVVAVAEDLLALEWIEPAPRAPDFDTALGEQLAALHRTDAGSFGFGRATYAGTIVQPNDPCPTWPEFYASRRLEPLVRRNVDDGRLPPDAAVAYERLADRLPELCGPPEPPAVLHGDLWGGNCIVGPAGEPVLVDPAVYGGHREVDLAMMRLFGGFSSRTFAAYDEAHPLAAGHTDRVPLYQLYPLLVHVALFGGGYAAAVRDVLRRYA